MRTATFAARDFSRQGPRALVHFKVTFEGPSPNPRPKYIAIPGPEEIYEYLDWIAQRFDVHAFYYQPNLFWIWDWEEDLVQAMNNVNLRNVGR